MERSLDYKGRWRNHTVAFRVSDEEAKLNSYLADIEEQAQERFERIVEQMKQAQGAGDYRIVKGR